MRTFLYTNTMKEYKALLIQKDVDKAMDIPVYDTQQRWGIVCKKFPFVISGEAKDIKSRSWPDEDGDDEFIPDTIPMKAYEVDVEFVCVCKHGEAQVNISSFVDYLTGRDSGYPGAKLKIYDTNTKIGRKNVRFSKYKDDAFSMSTDSEDVVVFSMTFKINDPTTQIILSA